MLHPHITNKMIDGSLFRAEVEAKNVLAVPMVFLNGEHFGQGRTSLEEILAKLDTGASAGMAAKLDAKEAYDVLVVGGGPAGAAAANRRGKDALQAKIVTELVEHYLPSVALGPLGPG